MNLTAISTRDEQEFMFAVIILACFMSMLIILIVIICFPLCFYKGENRVECDPFCECCRRSSKRVVKATGEEYDEVPEKTDTINTVVI